MLKELGVELVMAGRSERRHEFGEDNVMVNRKVRKALEVGFTTLSSGKICKDHSGKFLMSMGITI